LKHKTAGKNELSIICVLSVKKNIHWCYCWLSQICASTQRIGWSRAASITKYKQRLHWPKDNFYSEG
ncbi:hypothetical protein, partial [Vibrio sp. V39_P1S14PM300]|uniref:hypothetical protein n=1 Tax=Vibrio sp. V39_P1S14PM300 TaxID=1938690 RepID=UPI001F15909C